MRRRPLRQTGARKAWAVWLGLVLALIATPASAQAPATPTAEPPADFFGGAKSDPMGPETETPPAEDAPAAEEEKEKEDPPGPFPILDEEEGPKGTVNPPVPTPIPAPAMPEPPPLPAPTPLGQGDMPPAFLDPEVETTQAPAVKLPPDPTPVAGPGGLPVAVENPGAAKPEGPAPSTDAAFVLPVERLPFGRQSVGLTVEVLAPQFINVHKVAPFKIVVKNIGKADAMGVVVRDELPDGLEFVDSQPEARKTGNLLIWELETLAPDAERTITLNVKPTRTGPFDHAATLSLKAGAKFRTQAREPKLKVEQSIFPANAKVLKDKPVQFKITVSNPGDGPARNVIVRAKLSGGLREESGQGNGENLFEQTIDVIESGRSKSLDVLVADAVQGGAQSCEVVALSDDVPPNAPEAKSVQEVTVVEPKLDVVITGPKDRYTETLGAYTITLTNPGTATAENIKVLATLPASGRLYSTPNNAQFDAQTRRLSWSLRALEPGGKTSVEFQLRMGGVGQYPVGAQARADGVLDAKSQVLTDVTGIADVDLTVSENRRYIDVDDTTTFVIKVVNRGTAEATKLQIACLLTDTIVPIETSGTEKVANWDQKETLKFPEIERLGPGKMIELGIKVKANKPGPAFCRASLMHEGMKDQKERLEDVAVFKVMTTRR